MELPVLVDPAGMSDLCGVASSVAGYLCTYPYHESLRLPYILEAQRSLNCRSTSHAIIGDRSQVEKAINRLPWRLCRLITQAF